MAKVSFLLKEPKADRPTPIFAFVAFDGLDSYIPQNAMPFPVAQSWFSYDEQGRTKWLTRKNNRVPPEGIGFTMEYDYDSNGKVLTAAYTCPVWDNLHPQFTHYYSYDADQRLSEVRTNEVAPTNQTAPRTLRASYSYYLHGPVKRVVLGGLQGLDYRYTVQGWLKSINGVQPGSDPGNDATSTTGMLPDLFSQQLEYYAGDYASRQQPQRTFTASSTYTERFDGTLQASAWRTPSHPGLHGYGFQYDERGQLHQADYGQPVAGANGSLAFTADVAGRYSEGNLDYDPNGNLKSLRRTDRLGAFLMNINYQYLGNTNKLNWVRSTPATPLLDYTYDELGQLKSQQEAGKNLYFSYNARGKVTEVYRDAAKTIFVAKYTYDEFGQRMQQENSSGILAFNRDAAGHELGSYYYDGGLDQIALYEQPIYGAARLGVVRQPRNDDGQPGGQLYELSDQLGNTRVVFQAPHTDKYVLTMENGKVDQEKKDFPTPDTAPNLGATYSAVRTNQASFKASPYGQGYSMDLVARVGPGKKLSVAPGDRILLEVYAAYPSSTGGPILGRSVAAELPKIGFVVGSSALTAQPRPSDMTGARPLPAWQQLLSQLSVGVAIPLSSRRAKAPAPSWTGTGAKIAGAPANAGLHYLLRLVRTRGVVGSGFAPVTVDSDGNWKKLVLDLTVTAEEPCEMELWVENQDQMHVYFDDLSVEHQVGPIVQENHFYAYGQRNEWLSWARQNLRGYGRGYQGQNTRFDEETGYDNFELRMYDSRIGRWTSKDPVHQYSSPYIGMGNSPVNRTDANGGRDNPIFDTGGHLLGTDDRGLRGPGIVMQAKYFTQGMSHGEAMKHSLGAQGLSGSSAIALFNSTMRSLPSRPDYDGRLTKAEADNWWQRGTGQSLYVDESLINLSGATTLTFDNTPGVVSNRNFFFWNPGSDTGNVYGRLDMTLLDVNGTVSIGYINTEVHPNHQLVLDYYNFEPHQGEPVRNWFTDMGTPNGRGANFSIEGYGKGHVPVVHGFKH